MQIRIPQISIAKIRPGQVTARQIGPLPGDHVFQPFLMLCNDDVDIYFVKFFRIGTLLSYSPLSTVPAWDQDY